MYLHYLSGYSHKIFQGDHIAQGNPTYKFAWNINKMTNEVHYTSI